MPLQVESTVIVPPLQSSSALLSSVQAALPSFSGVHASPAAAAPRSHLAPSALATQPSAPLHSSISTQRLLLHSSIAFLSPLHSGLPSSKQGSPTLYAL